MPYTEDPTNSRSDAIRLLIGDTDPLNPSLSDAEVQYLIDQNPTASDYSIAAQLALASASKFANKADLTVGRLSIQYGQRYRQLLELAEKLANADTKFKSTGSPLMAGKGGRKVLGLQDYPGEDETYGHE